MELQSQNETKPKHEDLSASLADIEKKQMLFEAEVNSILDTPAPVEEKKAEEGEGCCSNGVCEKEAAANADAEMKDEEAAAAENSNAAEPEAAAADD